MSSHPPSSNPFETALRHVDSPISMTVSQTQFAVNLQSQRCVDTVTRVLQNQEGIDNFHVDLKSQTVVVEGSVAPSKIKRALKDAGREVIIRGSGAEGGDSNAAVCIFESFTPSPQATNAKQDFFGLARFVKSMSSGTIVDLTLQHQSENKVTNSSQISDAAYDVYVAKSGDISRGIISAGSPFKSLGTVQIDSQTGLGDLFKEFHEGLDIHSIIGRALVVTPSGGRPLPILVGVIARSSGLWGNEKSVCTCSGKTMWEENRDNRATL